MRNEVSISPPAVGRKMLWSIIVRRRNSPISTAARQSRGDGHKTSLAELVGRHDDRVTIPEIVEEGQFIDGQVSADVRSGRQSNAECLAHRRRSFHQGR